MSTTTLSPADQVRQASSYEKATNIIREQMKTNDQWVLRGLLRIYERQTADEQQSECTKHHNKIGFSGIDGGILTSFAQQVLKWQKTPESMRKYNRPLSPKQMRICRAKMQKYAGQLARIARENTE